MNLDKLNCPACDEEPLMQVADALMGGAEGYVDATCAKCPNCGFSVWARSGQTVELAVRALQGPLFRAICEAAEAEEART